MAPSIHSYEPPPPAQFGLKSLFIGTAGIALIFGAVYWIGFFATICCLLLAVAARVGYAMPARRYQKCVAALAASMATGLVLLFLAAIPEACTACRRSQCHNNLKQIALGLQCYSDIYGCLPPAYVADASGRPMHSWRVLVLPFIEQRRLYDQYDFDEPWDGPHNRLLADQIPPPYRCPRDATAFQRSPAITNYLAITGKNTVWPGTSGIAFSDITDGPADTIAVVEVASSGIEWMEPRDLPMAEFVKGVN